MQRYAQVIGVKPEQIESYEHIHATAWPEVLRMIYDANIRNYSIFRFETLLFAYFEYVGNNYEADMRTMAADPKTQEWWTHTEPMQAPLPGRQPGEWWASMREVFHTD